VALWSYVEGPLTGLCPACKVFLRIGAGQGIIRWAGRDWHIACVLQYLPEDVPSPGAPVLDYDITDWQMNTP
jgi:hypothetical protein